MKRSLLNAAVQRSLAPFAEQPDEDWKAFTDKYVVSNYGLVVNTYNGGVMPWRRADCSGNQHTWLVRVNDASLYVSSVVYAAFKNDGELLNREYRIQFVDGNAANVSLANLRAVPRRYPRERPLPETIASYADMLTTINIDRVNEVPDV